MYCTLKARADITVTKLLSSGLFVDDGISTLDLHTEVIVLRTWSLSDILIVGHQT